MVQHVLHASTVCFFYCSDSLIPIEIESIGLILSFKIAVVFTNNFWSGIYKYEEQN